MTQITNWPATVRELAEMSEQNGVEATNMLRELQKSLGPMPMPPSGYTLAPGWSDLWVGTETINSGWILTPGWTFEAGHSVNIWTVQHRDLTPTEALELAVALRNVVEAQ